jgi:phosphate transport system substrate-binding protein
LTRRLYFYNTSATSLIVDKFIRFAVSRQGQEVAQENHFVALLPQLIEGTPSNATPEFRRLTAGARRLSLSFRSESGSAELTPDRLAHDNIERLRSYIQRNSDQLIVCGFADSRPMRGGLSNQRLSELRAAAIAAELHDELGIPYSAMVVKGFGAAMPIDSNESETGQYRNRRVEIWSAHERTRTTVLAAHPNNSGL